MAMDSIRSGAVVAGRVAGGDGAARAGPPRGGAAGDTGGQAMSEDAPRTVRIVPSGPVMVQGPVRIEMDDGNVVESDRFMVAICACRRSRNYPFCDTSHRRRQRPPESGQRPA